MHFVGTHPEAVLHDVVGFADQLHVAVFDAVVHHLDVVAGAHFADPLAARRAAFHLGRHGLEDILDVRPGRGRAARHDARAVAGAFFATGNAGADVEHALAFDVFLPAVGVVEKRIATIDNDVTGFEVRDDLVDELVDRLAGLDQHHDAARALELGDHFFDRVRPLHLRALGLIGQELIHLVGRTVVSHHGKPMIVHVQNQVLTHDSQADQGNIRFLFHSISFR